MKTRPSKSKHASRAPKRASPQKSKRTSKPAHTPKLDETEHQSAEAFRKLTEASFEGIIIHDQGVILAANPAMAKLFGFSGPQEMIGKNGLEILPFAPESRDRIRDSLGRRSNAAAEITILRKDGTTFSAETQGRDIDYRGRAARVVAMRDVSQRKQMEEALRESESKYRALVEQAVDGVLVSDSDGKILLANRAMCTMLGYSPQEILMLNIADTYAAGEVVMLSKRLQQVAQRGSLKFERIMVRKDGSSFPVEAVTSITESGLIQGILRDNTDRRRAEDALLESEVKYRALVEHIPAVVYQSQNARTMFVNSHIESLLCYTAAEWIAEPALWSERLHSDDRARVLAASRATNLSGQPFEIEYRLLARDEREVWIYDRAELIYDSEGRPLFYQGVMFDITDRKHAEQEILKRVKDLTALHQASDEVLKLHEPQVLATKIMALLEKTLSYEYGAVLFLDEASGRLQPFAVAGGGPGPDFVRTEKEYILEHQPPPGKGITRWVAEHGQSVRLGNVMQDERYHALRNDIQSEMCVPLRVGDQIIGVINVETTRTDAYSEDDLRVLETIAAQVSIAVQNARLLEDANHSRDRLAELSRNLVEVHESEQRAIGRELHDQFGQMLTAVKLTLELASNMPLEAARLKNGQAMEIINDLLARVSALSLELRPPMLDDLGLIPALLWHVHRYQEQSGIEVEFKHSGVEGLRFDSQIESTAYRVVQEALTNAARHARATAVRLQVHARSGWLELRIEDNGQGFDPPAAFARKQSTGLSGMRERVGLVHGVFRIESSDGAGARLLVQLPL